jgi:hypothetical protein
MATVADRPDPYPPSWIDRLQAWIDALPAPAWVVYLVVFLCVAVANHVVAWIEGYVPVGSFDASFSSSAFFLVIGYGGIQLLDRISAGAWTRFRPLTSLNDGEAGRVAYELTTMPVRPVLVCVLLGVVTAGTYYVLQYGRPLELARGPIAFILGFPATCVIFAGTWALVYHSLHQLRVIGRAHRYVESIDLLHLERSHAFASVTAATGLALLALGYTGLATNPDALSNPQVLAWAVLTTVAGRRLLLRAAERDPRADRRREVSPARGGRATPWPGPRRPAPARRARRRLGCQRGQRPDREPARRAGRPGQGLDLAVVAGDAPRLRHGDRPADRPLARLSGP